MAMVDLYEGILEEFAGAQTLGSRHRDPGLNDAGVSRSKIRVPAPLKPWSARAQRGVLLDLILEDAP